MKPNIYLDIDGVLRVNELFAARYADEFLQLVLQKYPDSTYWLTTHCWRGENRAVDVLTPLLKPETVELIKTIKPTDWGVSKTDAIDFSRTFLWFDDDLFPEEREVLSSNGVLNNWIGVDLDVNQNALFEYIKDFPKPVAKDIS